MNYKQQSAPIHVENTILNQGVEALKLANSHETYRHMGLDGVISGSMSFLKSLISRPFKIKTHDKMPPSEKKLVEALNSSLGSLEPYSQYNLVLNWLSSLEYGCSLSEVVMSRKGAYTVFENITPINLQGVSKWRFDKGALKSVTISPPENDGKFEFNEGKETTINGDKLMLVKIQPSTEFPLGKSLLYGAWQAWKMKQAINEFSLVGHQKSLAGVVSVSAPSEYINRYHSDPTSDEALYLEELLKQAELLGAGRTSYVMLASDVYEGGQAQFKVAGIEGAKPSDFELNTTLERLNNEILLSLQSSILALGQTGGGSFALSDSKTQLVTLFVKSVQEAIASEFRQKALKLAYQANGFATDKLPHIEFEEIEPLDFATLTEGLYRLANAGLVRPDEDLENFAREAGGAPKFNPAKEIYESEGTMSLARSDDSIRAIKEV